MCHFIIYSLPYFIIPCDIYKRTLIKQSIHQSNRTFCSPNNNNISSYFVDFIPDTPFLPYQYCIFKDTSTVFLFLLSFRLLYSSFTLLALFLFLIRSLFPPPQTDQLWFNNNASALSSFFLFSEGITSLLHLLMPEQNFPTVSLWIYNLFSYISSVITFCHSSFSSY